MKKMILLTIGIGLLGFIAVGVYNAKQLQHIHIQKSVAIKGNAQAVFDNVLYLRNFPKWSPFYEADPTQKTEVKGPDGQVGAQFHWNGNEGKDLGYQEIKEVRALEYIKMGCDIQKPFQAQPTFEYSFKRSGEAVLVTQDFKLQSGLVDAFFMWLFGAKSNMDKLNGRGMELLKIASE